METGRKQFKKVLWDGLVSPPTVRRACWCGGRETDCEEDVLMWMEGDRL